MVLLFPSRVSLELFPDALVNAAVPKHVTFSAGYQDRIASPMARNDADCPVLIFFDMVIPQPAAMAVWRDPMPSIVVILPIVAVLIRTLTSIP